MFISQIKPEIKTFTLGDASDIEVTLKTHNPETQEEGTITLSINALIQISYITNEVLYSFLDHFIDKGSYHESILTIPIIEEI